MNFTMINREPDLKLAISRVKIIAPRLHAPLQDEARRHEVTSPSVTIKMEVVIATAHSENFSHSC